MRKVFSPACAGVGCLKASRGVNDLAALREVNGGEE